MRRLLVLSCLIVVLTACSSDNNANAPKDDNQENGLEEVTVTLDWTPNTNHTGLYVAKEKGYFQDAGLDVEIITPGEVGADQLVASGKAEFGIGYQEELTQARVEGVPIISIGAVIQHNTSGFASPKEKGITSPEDFVDKTYGGWGDPVEEAVMTSLMEQENADVDQVNIVNMGKSDFFTVVKRDIDFAWIYYGWTGVEAELRGEDLNMMYVSDYSDKLDYYTPVITTSEKMVQNRPETTQQFMAATSKGYEFAIDQPDEAADILIDEVPDLDEELVKASQQWLAPKFQDDAKRWGEQKQEVWENYANWMYNHDLLDHPLDSDKAFTNEFLPEGR